MALVSWSRVRAALIDDLGGIGTHEAVVVAVNQRPNLSGVLGLKREKGKSKEHAQRRKRAAVVVFRCFSLSKNRDLNIRAEA
jgi:hypothetical protein